MYDPQDPDMMYLALDKKKMAMEAPSFDGKKACWIPDDKEGYLKAEIISTTGDVVKVLTEKMDVSIRTSVSLMHETNWCI